MATTPPPPSPSSLRVPPAPRHGPAYDPYEPYPTRFSARLANQRVHRDEKTPPPTSPSARDHAGSKGSPKKQRKGEVEAMSPPTSKPSSPRKRAAGGKIKVGGSNPAHSLHKTSNLSDPFDIALPSPSQPNAQTASRSIMAGEMLPTPAKTPSKKAVDSSTAARALFPPTSSAGKKAKKHTGYSLDSFSDELAPKPAPIDIYTDSRDRVPTVDMSEDNPFYVNPAAKASEKPSTRSSKRQAAKRDTDVDESLTRDDGIYCVFRGKKVFNKFSEEADEEGASDLGLLTARPDLVNDDTSEMLSNVRPLTRSSIKPRILFPSEAHEEAATDDDEHAVAKNELCTPPPKSAVTTPASPGATMRLRSTTRFDKLQVDATPTGPVADIKKSDKKKRGSPFDGWQRKKQSPDDATGAASKKREAGSVDSSGGPAVKKTRNVRAT